MDKRYVLTKILESMDIEDRLHTKLIEPKETEVYISDTLKASISISAVRENEIPELEVITHPLLEVIRHVLGIDEGSFLTDDISNISFDTDMPISERVERLLELHE